MRLLAHVLSSAAVFSMQFRISIATKVLIRISLELISDF
jgi:hypothetical protein